MARGYKRLTRKARHVIRHLRRTKHASVQDQMIHELKHEVSRTHGFKGPGKAPDHSKAGHWRPLTRKAKQMLTRLRKAKVWSVQKQIVNELAREIEHGRRIAQRVQELARRARERAEAAAERVRAGAERAERAARTAGRKTRSGWNRARPHAARAGRKFRATVNRGQERLLTRTERKQAGREKDPRIRGRGQRLRVMADTALFRMRKRTPARRKAPPRPVPRSVAARVNASRTRFDKSHVRYVNQAGRRTPGQPVFRRTRTRTPGPRSRVS